MVVATKFLPRSEEDIKNNVSGQQHIHNMVNKSLTNLGLDYIDLYIYHMWDYNTPLYDLLEGLNEVIEEGKVRYIVYQIVLLGSLQRLMHWLMLKVFQNLFLFKVITI